MQHHVMYILYFYTTLMQQHVMYVLYYTNAATRNVHSVLH